MGCFVVVLRIKYLGSNKMLIYVKKKNKNNLKEYVGVGRIELRLKICSLLPLLVSFDKIVFQKYFVFITVVFQNIFDLSLQFFKTLCFITAEYA